MSNEKDMVEVGSELPKTTVKQRLLEAQGREIPLDLFLFSCFEHERLLANKNRVGLEEIRWPLLADESAIETEAILNTKTFESALEDLMGWYQSQYPELGASTPLDRDVLSLLIPPCVALARDIERLHQVKVGSGLPEVPSSTVPTPGVWAVILDRYKTYFPNHAKFLSAYIKWVHAPPMTEDFEPGSRPPVGRYAPPPLRREGPGGGRRSSGAAGDFPGGARRRGSKPAADDGVRPPRGPRSTGGRGDGDSGPRRGQGRGDSSPRRGQGDGPRPRRDRRGPRSADLETQQLSEAALAEVDQALAKLQQDPGLKSVTLNPSNSFYRRLQHQKIVEAGFVSNSIGEGADRAVSISRKE